MRHLIVPGAILAAIAVFFAVWFTDPARDPCAAPDRIVEQLTTTSAPTSKALTDALKTAREAAEKSYNTVLTTSDDPACARRGLAMLTNGPASEPAVESPPCRAARVSLVEGNLPRAEGAFVAQAMSDDKKAHACGVTGLAAVARQRCIDRLTLTAAPATRRPAATGAATESLLADESLRLLRLASALPDVEAACTALVAGKE